MDKRLVPITIRKIGGYVFIISMLLLGSVLCAWWVLNSQIASLRSDEAEQVSYIGPGLSDIVSNQTSLEYSIASKDIVNKTIKGVDIADGSITVQNLNQSVVEMIEEGNADPGLIASVLNLSLEDLLAKLEALGIPLSDITSLQILDGTISLSDLDTTVNNTLSLAGTVADGAITSLKIADGAIGTLDIADGAITTDLLASASVTSGILGLGAVGSTHLAANAVTAAAIQDGSIDATELAAGAVGATQLATGAVTSTKILDGTIATDDIAGDAITGALIDDGTISGTDLASSIISNSHIVDGTIGTLDISSGAITGALIADGTVDTADINDNAISALKLAASAVTSAKILDGTIAAGDIADGAIGATQLATNAVTSTKILDGTIAAGDIAGSAVDASKLSTTANKKTVAVQIGDITIVMGDTERPVFVAPTNGTITKVSFTNALNITAGLNKGVISLERKTATTATVASVDLGTISLTGYTPQSPTLGSGTSFSTGDVYSFKWDAGLVGVALTGFLVTIEYTASE